MDNTLAQILDQLYVLNEMVIRKDKEIEQLKAALQAAAKEDK